MKTQLSILMVSALLFSACQKIATQSFDVDQQLAYCAAQASKTLVLIPPGDSLLPRNVDQGKTDWRFVPYRDWTSGFFPGILWYLYEASGEEKWFDEADHYSRILTPLCANPAMDHDLGFQIYSSFGNGYRLKNSLVYKALLQGTAYELSKLYNPKVGTILSWPGMVQKMNWPHNTIIDNMINLELLFWASKNGGSAALYDQALNHARVTMKNQFRKDHTVYHVVVYDTLTGKSIKKVTHQGYADESMWARGQAWAIYGYTMCYRETKEKEFLDFAQKVSDVYLQRLPEDCIPYWDFDAPGIPNAPRDASAAAITASGLLELSALVADGQKSKYYREMAEKMLIELSSERYQSRDKNTAFLMHSTGHHPNGTEIDASIIYADYYYLEALLRLKKLQHKPSN